MLGMGIISWSFEKQKTNVEDGEGGPGMFLFMSLAYFTISTWMASWLFWAGFLQVAGEK